MYVGSYFISAFIYCKGSTRPQEDLVAEIILGRSLHQLYHIWIKNQIGRSSKIDGLFGLDIVDY